MAMSSSIVIFSEDTDNRRLTHNYINMCKNIVFQHTEVPSLENCIIHVFQLNKMID